MRCKYEIANTSNFRFFGARFEDVDCFVSFAFSFKFLHFIYIYIYIKNLRWNDSLDEGVEERWPFARRKEKVPLLRHLFAVRRKSKFSSFSRNFLI